MEHRYKDLTSVILSLVSLLLIGFVTSSLSFAQESGSENHEQLISMSFREADLDYVLDFFSQATGYTIVKDAEIKARVTIISQKEISVDQALSVLNYAGLENIHIGVLGGEWYGIPDKMTMNSEWKTLTRDLEGRISKELLDEYRTMDQAAWMKGIRVLYVPTFFAMGWKKWVRLKWINS